MLNLVRVPEFLADFNTTSISILDYIDRKKWKYLNDPTTAEAQVGDLSAVITRAMLDSAYSGKPLVFSGPEANLIGGTASTNQNWYFPVSTPLQQTPGCTILSGGIGTCYLIPTSEFPAQSFLLSWAPGIGQPRMRLEGLGFSGGNYKSKIIGGFCISRGLYLSAVKNIFIRDCYYGGFLIKPQAAAGQSVATDIVNLNIDGIFILNSGNPAYYQAFDIQFSSAWGSGNWTDGAIRNVDVSTAFTDNPSIIQAPVSLNLVNISKQIFNVLFERWYTSASRNTHIKIYSNSNIRNTNLTFQNFSGDGVAKATQPMIDIDGLGWSHMSDMYRGSLVNAGMRVASATQCVFSGMVFGASTDASGNYLQQLYIASTCDNVSFRDCYLRSPFTSSSPYQYRNWFGPWIEDYGVNTKWDSPQFSSEVTVQRGFDFFNATSAGKCTNATSQNNDIVASTVGSSLQLRYPSTTGAATPSLVFPVSKGYVQGPQAEAYVYVMMKVQITSGNIGTHFLRFNLYDAATTWTPSAMNEEVVLIARIPVNGGATNQNLIISPASNAATTNAVTYLIKDIVITSGPLPWPTNYRKALQVI